MTPTKELTLAESSQLIREVNARMEWQHDVTFVMLALLLALKLIALRSRRERVKQKGGAS